jgi:UDP-glucose 4-epimerase
MSEALIPQPEDPYGIAKYAVEMDLGAASKQFGLDYTIFRPHNVYGEHQNIGDKYRNVVGIFMNQLMSGLPLTIFGDGTQTRAFSYIDDVAPAIAASVDLPDCAGEIYNIGADLPHSVLHLAHVVANEFGVTPEIEFLPERNEVLHAYATHEKVRAAFPLAEPTPLEIGIGRMADWARSVGPRKTRDFEGVEVWRSFPPGWESAVVRPGE